MVSKGETPLSSPDPLVLSNENIPTPSPTKSRGPIITPRKPLVGASGNARVQDFYISTPPIRRISKSPTKAPRQSASPSPWRIRLTVQAEQVDPHNTRQEEISPAKRVKERTTTVTVPLKGGDDTPPAAAKRGRGRPRKSLDSPKKRSGTPRPKNTRNAKVMQEVSDGKDNNASLATTTPPKKAKGRPRKSTGPCSDIQQPAETESTAKASATEEMALNLDAKKMTYTRSKGRRKELTPMRIALDSDAQHDFGGNVDSGTPMESEDDIDKLPEIECPKLDVSHPHTTQTMGVSRDIHLEPPSVPSVVEEQDQDMWRSTARSKSFDCSENHEEPRQQAYTNPTDIHQDYDTILESEGFSMVSVSSLNSTDNRFSPSCSRNPRSSNRGHTPAIDSSPSAPPALQNNNTQTSSRQLNEYQDGTPKLNRVVRAGIALQGVLSPRDRSQRLSSPFHEPRSGSSPLAVLSDAGQPGSSISASGARSPKEHLDDLFDGFGAGTRRELRAGLRLGEELARRQRNVSESPFSISKGDEDVFYSAANSEHPRLPQSDIPQTYNLKVPIAGAESGCEVVYPSLPETQLPTPERSEADADDDRMSWKEQTPEKLGETEALSPSEMSNIQATDSEASVIDYTMMARQAEWQREREAVSRQIEMANKSQVIVIDSDDDDDEVDECQEDLEWSKNRDQNNHVVEEEDVSDIWQAEAQSGDSSRDSTPEVPKTLMQPEMMKPRRSKIPSPWRRSSQVTYSDEAEPTESDLFWQPDNARRKVKLSQIEDRKEVENNGGLDQSQTELSIPRAQDIHQSHNPPDDSTSLLIANQLNTVRISNRETVISASVPEKILLNKDTHTTSTDSFKEANQRTFRKEISFPTPENRHEEMSEHSRENRLSLPSSVARIPTENVDKEPPPIDPLLLQPQKPDRKPKQSHQCRRPISFQSSPSDQSSWLSLLTAPVYRLVSSSAALSPPATKSDILDTSVYEPLCQLTPWEPRHNRALGPLYYGSLLYGAHIFPYNSNSPSAAYLGNTVITRLGWSRQITKADCSVTDAFMIILEERGYASDGPDENWIDELLVLKMCIALWVGMVMRGEVDANTSKGEKVGLRLEGDRPWTKEDTKWEQNSTEYFERKRREFSGLPSWKEKGIKWP